MKAGFAIHATACQARWKCKRTNIAEIEYELSGLLQYGYYCAESEGTLPTFKYKMVRSYQHFRLRLKNLIWCLTKCKINKLFIYIYNVVLMHGEPHQ